MTTAIDGIVKIGKCQKKQYEERMRYLEQNGYRHVSVLHRFYAKEVHDYDRKEALLHTIFSKSQVSKTELFATDASLVKELLEAFEGRQIFPTINAYKNVSKKKLSNLTETKSSKKKAPRFTFEMLDIPIGSELTYIKDNSVIVKTVDMVNKIAYKNKTYTLSGILLKINGGRSWDTVDCFTYNGKKLKKLREEKEKKT